jgi:hypothetical protein
MAKLTTEKMDLMTAKVEAAAQSRKLGKVIFINVDGEGDCTLSDKQDPSSYTAYKGGNEVALSNDLTAVAESPKKKSSKKVEKQNDVDALLETEPKAATKKSENKNTKVMTTKTKKSAKKTSKKVRATAHREPRELQEIKAGSFAEAIKLAKKDGLKKAIAVVKGKSYGLRIATGWAVVKNIVDNSKDGMIMVTDAGTYVYPKAQFKNLFSKIFASGTYAAIGIYAQSTVAASHDEYLLK